MTLSYQPIGVIHSPFEGIENVPIQPTAADGIHGTVKVFAELYHFHCVTQARLTVIPFLDPNPRGVFATRAPSRPNPIGLSIVRLLSIEGNVLRIENVDIVDGTPLLDIKPYVPEFDHHKAERTGWLVMAGEKVKEKRSDDRFR